MNNFIKYRLWEILPGLITWITIVTLLYLAAFKPTALIVLVIIYTTYWLIKILIITGHQLVGYQTYLKQTRLDWLAKLKQDFPQSHSQIYQIALIPSYKEDISILRQTIESLKGSTINLKKIIVVLAFEEREKELAPKYAPILEKEYKDTFKKFLITFHPTDIEGEVKGKGPNITWAGRQVQKYLEAEKIPFEDVILTTIDADNRVDRQFFANLTWAYCNDPDPTHKSFQPIPLFFNNVWQVPLVVRMISLGDSYWQMIQSVRPNFLRNFSSHSQSMAALVQTDFWSVKTIVEDGHQYWRSYFAFNGNHHVVPIYSPIYMDSVQGDDLLDTLKEQYLQRRRWFWGVSDVPYVWQHSLGNNTIPFFYKWAQFVRLVEGHYNLATQSIYLTIGSLPLLINSDFKNTVAGYTFPIMYQYLLSFAWIGMLANMLISAKLLPAKSDKKHINWLFVFWQWLLTPIVLPVSAFFFAALPAIDSQTRMLIKKPFTVFNVTKKQAVPGGILRKS